MSLLGTLDFLVSSLTLPNTMTHHPQIATTAFPMPIVVPKPPILLVLYETTAARVVRPVTMLRSGVRSGCVLGGSYVGTRTRTMISAKESRPSESDRHRKDSRGVRVS